jgi:hypothetical protein
MIDDTGIFDLLHIDRVAVYTIRDGGAAFWCSVVATQDCSKGPDLLAQWKRDDWQSSLHVENNIK